MAAVDEIQELDRRVAELSKGIQANRYATIGVTKAVQRALDKVEAERHALNVARANLRHMRGPADFVVLSEFVEVRKIADEKQHALLLAQAELAKADSALRALQRNLPQMEGALDTCKRLLTSYGTVTKFEMR